MFALKVKTCSPEKLGDARLRVFTESGDNPYDRDVYLLNNTGEMLEYVEFCSATMITVENEAYGDGTEEWQYTNVKQGDAVKVEQFDILNDSDCLLQVQLKIKSPLLGIQKFTCMSYRAKPISKVLLK